MDAARRPRRRGRRRDSRAVRRAVRGPHRSALAAPGAAAADHRLGRRGAARRRHGDRALLGRRRRSPLHARSEQPAAARAGVVDPLGAHRGAPAGARDGRARQDRHLLRDRRPSLGRLGARSRDRPRRRGQVGAELGRPRAGVRVRPRDRGLGMDRATRVRRDERARRRGHPVAGRRPRRRSRHPRRGGRVRRLERRRDPEGPRPRGQAAVARRSRAGRPGGAARLPPRRAVRRDARPPRTHVARRRARCVRAPEARTLGGRLPRRGAERELRWADRRSPGQRRRDRVRAARRARTTGSPCRMQQCAGHSGTSRRAG